MKVFFTNCRPHNWEACYENNIFGIKEGRGLPAIDQGDLILFRIGGSNYGVNALWLFDEAIKVDKRTHVPWDDAEYGWILKCTPIIDKFSKPFREEFATKSKVSQKIEGLYAARLMGSIGMLRPFEALAYLEKITEEFGKELEREVLYNDETIIVSEFINNLTYEIKSKQIKQPVINRLVSSKQVKEQSTSSIESKYGIVGERIDLPILNYAPLNEMGVVLLFGYYLQELGFSHLEEIRSDFPDAFGMQKIGTNRYRRVRIEFEFRSRNFILHKHPVDECDVIVCWENNWADCPLQVIELQSILFENQ